MIVSKDGGIKAKPHITGKEGIGIIRAAKGIDEAAFAKGNRKEIIKN